MSEVAGSVGDFSSEISRSSDLLFFSCDFLEIWASLWNHDSRNVGLNDKILFVHILQTDHVCSSRFFLGPNAKSDQRCRFLSTNQRAPHQRWEQYASECQSHSFLGFSWFLELQRPGALFEGETLDDL